MQYDFDKPVNRRGTQSEKWADRFTGTADALPMWVADMDFKAAPEITAVLSERLAHGVYGYSYPEEADYAAAVNWRMARCEHAVKPDWVTFSSGVVCSIKAAVQAFTAPGDAVVVQTPIYPPFLRIPATYGRRTVKSPLLRGESGVWRMDFDHLEDCFRAGARMMLLCASHNPVGRVWSTEELTAPPEEPEEE